MHNRAAIATDQDKVQIKILTHSHGISMMAVNLNGFGKQLSIDLSRAEHIEHSGDLKVQLKLRPFESQIFQHLFCARPHKEYSYPYTYSFASLKN